MDRGTTWIAVAGALVLTFASPAWAWIPNGEVTRIVDIWSWEGGGSHVIKTEDGYFCRINTSTATGRELLAMALAAHLAGRLANVTCHDEERILPGYPNFHEIHRLILLP